MNLTPTIRPNLSSQSEFNKDKGYKLSQLTELRELLEIRVWIYSQSKVSNEVS